MNSRESRDSVATGWQWASRISSIALEFSLPALAGWWIDGFWNFGPLGVIVGATLGFVIGMIHLIKISRAGKTN